MTNPPNSPTFLNGQLLIADPTLHDGTFHKSVIFIAEHNAKDGAYGFIINQPTDQTVGDLLPKEAFKDLKDIRVFIGGPIGQEHLTFASFSTQKNKKIKLTSRISAQEAIKHTQQPGTLVRAFAGYTGWTSGQLEGELENNSWITTPPIGRLLQVDHEKPLWGALLREISSYHQILAEVPDDIFVN